MFFFFFSFFAINIDSNKTTIALRSNKTHFHTIVHNVLLQFEGIFTDFERKKRKKRNTKKFL